MGLGSIFIRNTANCPLSAVLLSCCKEQLILIQSGKSQLSRKDALGGATLHLFREWRPMLHLRVSAK